MYKNIDFQLKNRLHGLKILKPTKGVRILTYHGIVDTITHPRLERNFHTTSIFIEHLKQLKRNNFKIITPDQLLDLKNPENEIKTVMLSFDDGYLNNYKAMEILNDFNFPGVFFVSTASIGSDHSIWTVNVELLLLEGNLNTLYFNNKNYNNETIKERQHNFQIIRNEFKQMPANKRKIEYENFLQQFPDYTLNELIAKFPSFKMFNWSQLKKLHQSGINFQSHGHHHEIHHQFQNNEIIEDEILNSKLILEKKLNKKVDYFAYPNGNFEHSLSAITLKNSGYIAAFRLGSSKVSNQGFPYIINRMDPHTNKHKFLNALFV